ncbi:hypothetical protein TYRP_022144, partial [Tyrophagus putrescentiae]
GLWSTAEIKGSGVSFPLAKRSKLKYCKVDVFLDCYFEPLFQFSHTPTGTGFPLNETEYEQWCFNIHDYFPYCGRQWLRKCASPIHEDLVVGLLLKPMQQTMREICSNSSLRKDFLQQVDCMTYQVKLTTEYRSRCVRRLQGDFETVSAHYYRPKSGQSWAQHLSSYLRGACCAYNAWENCIVGMLTDQCGPSSGAIFRRFIKHLGMYLWDGFCPMERFNPMESTGDQCPPGIYQSPSDFEPMGVRSLSLFSRYFAYACPNAAYGIV